MPHRVARPAPATDAGILRIDHIVGNVELGRMEEWADWYSRVLGFKRYISFDDKGDIKNGALTLYTYKCGQRSEIAVVH